MGRIEGIFFHKIPTLVVEMSIKMWVPDRKLKCEKCKFKTCYTLDYAKHKDTHIIPGLACNICKCELNTPQAYGEHMEIHHPSIVFSSPEESVPSPPQESIPITQKSILTTPAPLPPASNTSNEESKYLSIDIINNKARYNRIDAKYCQMAFRSVPTNPYLESLVKQN